jgi:hypothetical protein
VKSTSDLFGGVKASSSMSSLSSWLSTFYTSGCSSRIEGLTSCLMKPNWSQTSIFDGILFFDSKLGLSKLESERSRSDFVFKDAKSSSP